MEIAVFALVPILAILAAVTWVLWQALRGLYWILLGVGKGLGGVGRRTARFVSTEFIEAVHVAGGLLTATVLLPLAGINMAIGRWRTGRHYGRALEDELADSALGIYRIAIGHPLRFLGLGGLIDGLERRIPEVMDRAPRRVPRTPVDEFEGYVVTGTLPAGGSGALLYLARPTADTLARAAAEGREMPHEVVVKSFALVQGSTLPQIVRESRALEAANRLGLVLEHHLEEGRFFYVMRYVRGDELDTVVQRMHAKSGSSGLSDEHLASTLTYGADMLENLDRFHQGGLWHKDVKPANLIVSDGHAHLVDFGLVTPLQSALTLTTHGTEYYRDPEMVRLAMQGVKVHEVDGVKFDLYSAGAVLFSMVENSFPAHGSLSSITKRCPEALTWIIRRAMADIDSRYPSAYEMLADLRAVAEAQDAFLMRPADLPSVRGGGATPRDEDPLAGLGVFSSKRAPGASHASGAATRRPYVAQAAHATDPASGEEREDSHGAVRRDGGRRRRRGSVFGRVVAAGFLLFIASKVLIHEPVRDGYERHVASHVEPLDLFDFEREAYRKGQAILEQANEMEGDLEVGRWRRLWDSHLDRQLPERAQPGTELVSRRGGSEASRSQRSYSLEGDTRLAGQVLILEESSLRGRAFEEPTLGALREELQARGFAIAESADSEAGARHAVGLGSLEDAEAHDRLQRYLDRESSLDAIVWIAGGEVPRYRVLVRRQTPHAAPERLE